MTTRSDPKPFDPQSPFGAYLSALMGDALEAFLQHPPIPTFVRTNTLSHTPAQVEHILTEGYGLRLRPHPLSPLVREVVEPGDAGPGGCLHHFTGAYAIQSLGSMVPPLVLDPQPGERVLDLCASPGSKTSQMAAMMQGEGELWANDLSGKRMNPLASVLDASGARLMTLINRDGALLPKLVPGRFDRVLADVPCSGLGCRANLAQNREYFDKRGGPTRLPDLQYRLLLAALKLVRPGGRVVYSTCSLTVEENEAVLDQVLRKFPVRLLPVPDMPGLTLREGRTMLGDQALNPQVRMARRITPYENPTEGFFVALMTLDDAIPERYQARQERDQVEAVFPTLPWDHEDVAPILEELHRTYGVPVERLAQGRFIRRRKHLDVVPATVETFWKPAMRVGGSLATRSSRRWRLSHTSVQRFKDAITRHIIHLDRAQMAILAETGTAELRPEQLPDGPWPILSAEGVGPFARGIFLEGRLRWKTPRRYVPPRATFA